MEDTYRILIPTDYSETADHALEIGVVLSKRANSEVHILHIEDIPPDWVKLAENSESSLYSNVKNQLGLVKGQLSDRLELARNRGADAESFLEYNQSYRAILAHAENYEIDLVVMGAHGHSGLRGLLVGSYTRRVLHHTAIPVLVTKHRDVVNDLRTIVFVSDFDPKHSESLSKAVRIAQKARAELEVLFINTPSTFRETEDIHKRIDKYVETVDKGIITRIDIINALRFEVGLARYCEQKDIDIIAMPIYHKRHSWDVMGGTIEDIMYHIGLPVLGIPVDK